MELDQLKFPIGKYLPPANYEPELIEEWIEELAALPKNLREIVENLSYESLDWTYKPNSWTIKQVVHHLADSHVNSFIRFKLILTEDTPTVRPYDQDAWAMLPDGNSPEIVDSLSILQGIHGRLATLLSDLDTDDLDKNFFHPEYEGTLTLKWLIGLYAWHSRHHLAHIKQAIEKEGDFTWLD